MCRKIPNQVFILWSIITFQSSLLGGELRNLGFDEANTNLLSNPVDDGDGQIRGYGLPSVLLPGWDVYLGNTQIATDQVVQLNARSSLTVFISVIESDYSDNGMPPFRLVEGQFGYVSRPAVLPIALVQHGRVPSDAAVLTFRYYDGLHIVSANGQALRPLTFNPRALEGVRTAVFDISAFAGQEVELRFLNEGGLAFLDSIGFAVPELSPVALWSLAGLILWGWRLQKSRA